MFKTKLNNFKDLQPIEVVILTNAINMLNLIESINEDAIKAIKDGRFTEAKELVEKAEYFKYDPAFLKEMKKQVLDYSTLETLDKIVNNIPFDTKYNFSDDNRLIPIEVLPKLSSYDKIDIKNPKASIYKRLGATITA